MTILSFDAAKRNGDSLTSATGHNEPDYLDSPDDIAERARLDSLSDLIDAVHSEIRNRGGYRAQLLSFQPTTEDFATLNAAYEFEHGKQPFLKYANAHTARLALAGIIANCKSCTSEEICIRALRATPLGGMFDESAFADNNAFLIEGIAKQAWAKATKIDIKPQFGITNAVPALDAVNHRFQTLNFSQIKALELKTESGPIEGLLTAGSARPHGLFGFPEAGKSTLAHELAFCVASGEYFLGMKTNRCDVLFYKTEDSPTQVRQQIAMIGRDGTGIVYMFGEEGVSLEENIAGIHYHFTHKPDIGLVIIETLESFTNRKADDNEAMNEAFALIKRELCAKYPHAAFLIIHHVGKKSKDDGASIYSIRGATAIAGHTQAKLYLEATAEGRRIFSTGSRSTRKVDKTYLDYDPATLWSTLGDSVKRVEELKKQHEATERNNERIERILTVVEQEGGISKRELAKKARGKTADTLALIDDLIRSGMLTFSGNGIFKNNAL